MTALVWSSNIALPTGGVYGSSGADGGAANAAGVVVLIGFLGGGTKVVISTDGGLTWGYSNNLPTGWTIGSDSVCWDPVIGAFFTVSYAKGIAMSTDGMTWGQVLTGGSGYQGISSDGNGTVRVNKASTNQVLVSTNGSTWNPTAGTAPASLDLCTGGGTGVGYASHFGANLTIARTLDGGASWADIPPATTPSNSNLMINARDSLLLASWSTGTHYMQVSTDKGSTFHTTQTYTTGATRVQALGSSRRRSWSAGGPAFRGDATWQPQTCG